MPRVSETDAAYTTRYVVNNEVNVDDIKGLHETQWWYENCKYRKANGGIVKTDKTHRPTFTM